MAPSPAGPGGGDLAVEAVEVELEGLELERGRGGVELAGAEDDLRDQLGELGASPMTEDGCCEVAAEALGGEAGERGGEDGVEVGVRELRLAQLGQRDAEGEEGALGLLAAVEGLAGAVGRARGDPPDRLGGAAPERRRRGGEPSGRALDELRADPEPARRQLRPGSSRRMPGGSGLMTAPTCEQRLVVVAPRSSVRSIAKRANGTAPSSSARIALGAALLPHDVRRVRARGQPDDAELERGPGSTERGRGRGLLARRVGVEARAATRRREALRARRPARSVSAVPISADRVAKPGLVQRDDVGVALDEHDRARPCAAAARARSAPNSCRPLGKTSPSAEFTYFGRWSVAHRPRAEPEHPPARVGQREHDPAAEEVVDPPPSRRAAPARRRAAPRS